MNKKIKIILLTILMLLPLNVIFAKEVVKPDEYEKDSTVWVMSYNGIKYYSDTNESSENELGVIPHDSIVFTNARKYVDADIWLYIKYNNQNGWIILAKNMMSSEVAYGYNETMLTGETVDLYASPKENAKIVGSVPSNTTVSIKYVHGAVLSWYYTEYNGITGWIKGTYSFVQESYNRLVLLNDTYVYEEPDGKKTSTKVEKDKIINVFGTKDSLDKNNNIVKYALTEINGEKKWILISGNNVNYAEQIDSNMLENETATIVSGDKIYSSANSKAKEIGVIEDSTKITEAYKYKDSKGNDSYYIVSSSGTGWVLKEFYDYKEEDDKSDITDNTSKDNKNNLSNGVIWIVCSIICILVILIIIFIVKKNKKEINSKE